MYPKCMYVSKMQHSVSFKLFVSRVGSMKLFMLALLLSLAASWKLVRSLQIVLLCNQCWNAQCMYRSKFLYLGLHKQCPNGAWRG
jgi:hypothetical protein